MDNLLSLDGRVALVTGAGQGIGAQVARHFAAHGAQVVVTDYFLDRAEAVAKDIAGQGGEALALQLDVTDHAAAVGAVAEAERAYGRLDILVNNAGNAGPGASPLDHTPFWETDPGVWDRWLGVNLHGVLHCAHAALPGMIERNYGRVVTVISDAGRVGESNLVVYSAAKAGAAGASRALAKAVGRHSITVNCVAAAMTRTPAAGPLLEDEAVLKKMLQPYVIRRMGEPSDIANAVLFLASGAASWITGQTYPVNGGYSFAQ